MQRFKSKVKVSSSAEGYRSRTLIEGDLDPAFAPAGIMRFPDPLIPGLSTDQLEAAAGAERTAAGIQCDAHPPVTREIDAQAAAAVSLESWSGGMAEAEVIYGSFWPPE